MAATQRERINFSKIKEVIDFPNLIEIQKKSYAEFLQLGVDKTKRVEDGLEAVFKEALALTMIPVVFRGLLGFTQRKMKTIRMSNWDETKKKVYFEKLFSKQ